MKLIECICEILKGKDNLTPGEITDILYEKYPDYVEKKILYYKNNNINKTDNDVKNQLKAEIGSTLHQSKKFKKISSNPRIYSLDIDGKNEIINVDIIQKDKISFMDILKEILKENDNITTNEIVEILYKKYPEYTEKKTLYYKNNNIPKTFNEIKNQIAAEVSSNLNRQRNYPIFSKTSTNPSRYSLNKSEKQISVIEKEPLIIEKNIEYKYFCDDNYNIIKYWVEDNEVHFEKTTKVGYTYIFINKTDEHYKIGRTSSNPIDRLKQLKCGNPYLDIYFVIPFEENEKILHQKFSHIRKTGTEFFFPVDKLKEYMIKEYNNIQILKNMYKRYGEIQELKNQNINDLNKIQ